MYLGPGWVSLFCQCGESLRSVKLTLYGANKQSVALLRIAPKNVELLRWSSDDRALVGWEGYTREVVILSWSLVAYGVVYCSVLYCSVL